MIEKGHDTETQTTLAIYRVIDYIHLQDSLNKEQSCGMFPEWPESAVKIFDSCQNRHNQLRGAIKLLQLYHYYFNDFVQ